MLQRKASCQLQLSVKHSMPSFHFPRLSLCLLLYLSLYLSVSSMSVPLYSSVFLSAFGVICLSLFLFVCLLLPSVFLSHTHTKCTFTHTYTHTHTPTHTHTHT